MKFHMCEKTARDMASALRVAALQFEIDAQRNAQEAPRVATAFRRQSDDANAWAETLEGAADDDRDTDRCFPSISLDVRP